MQKLKETISRIERIDFSLAKKTQKRLDFLTKPQGSLGKLEELAKQIVEITRKDNPVLKNKVIFTLAGDHGVTEEGISAFPREVTSQMVYNFLNGGAGINVLANHIGAKVIVVDMGVAEEIKVNSQKSIVNSFKNRKINFGTKNFTKGPAMTMEEAVFSIEAGIEVFEEEFENNGIDIVGTGDMGIGNTTASSAMVAVIAGCNVEDVTGRGTGINDKGLKNKIAVIKKAILVNNPNPKDGIDVLAKVGGFEIGGLAGVILGAASRRVPVIVDCFISGAAALLAYTIEPKVKDYLIVSHCSVEKGHNIINEILYAIPLLNLELRLGEGTGAALAMGIVDASVKILTQMATFEHAGVSNKES